MLNFDSGLLNSLKNPNSVSFWVLKLYYNSEDSQALQADGSTANLLNEALDATETGVDVDYGAAFIAGDYIIVGSEVMKVSSISSNTLTVVRGAKGTTAATHSNNATINFDNWVGVSDSHRVDSVDTYHGIVSSWGNHQQSLNLYKFTTSTGNMTVTLINAENSIQGGRFSDLFSSKNFANRKWELFHNTNDLTTFDTAARMIGSGIIAGDIKYDTGNIMLTLLDNSSTYHKLVPYHTVDSTNYANAPDNNLNAAVPMSYGDFSQTTTNGDFENHFVKGHFPAIIVNKEDSDGFKHALPDTDKSYVDITGSTQNDKVLLDKLYANNIYLGIDGHFLQCATGNVKVGNVSAGNDDEPENDEDNIIKFTGSSFFAYFDFESLSDAGIVENTDRLVDRSFSSTTPFGANGSTVSPRTMSLRFPTIPRLGELISSSRVDIIIYSNGGTGTLENVAYFKIDAPGTDVNLTFTTSENTQTVAFASDAFTASLESLDFSTPLTLSIHDSDGAIAINIGEIGLQVEFIPDQVYTRTVYKRELIYTGASHDPGGYRWIDKELNTDLTAQNLDYIYYAGKGREYGAWIDADSRNNGFNEEGLIENPVYIIEDILRNECGLTSTQIDYETFDTSGNYDSGTPANDGHLKDVYGEDKMIDIKFAFSNYKFINSKNLIESIGRQCCSYVFIGGDGKIKIKTLRRQTDYTSENKIINYYDIQLNGISKTPLSEVKNDITINYAFNYQDETFTASKNTTDSTSLGTGSAGNNQTLKLELDAFGILDDDTATQLADAYKALFKDQKVILDFNCLTPKYNNLEIGDIIKFKNWDSKIKLYGSALVESGGTTDYFIIQNISKNPSGSSIKAIKVSE